MNDEWKIGGLAVWVPLQRKPIFLALAGGVPL
jgi:hypothetical protein